MKTTLVILVLMLAILACGTKDLPSTAVPMSPSTNALQEWDDNGNGRITCAEAKAHGIAPVRRGHPAYPYMRDADDDGVVCE